MINSVRWTGVESDGNILLNRRSGRGFKSQQEDTLYFFTIGTFVNCAVKIKSQSERIKMVLDAASRYLDIVDILGEETIY